MKSNRKPDLRSRADIVMSSSSRSGADESTGRRGIKTSVLPTEPFETMEEMKRTQRAYTRIHRTQQQPQVSMTPKNDAVEVSRAIIKVFHLTKHSDHSIIKGAVNSRIFRHFLRQGPEAF